MSDLKTAAQQALEAWDTRAGIDTASRAFEALRAALAEQNRAWYTIDEINAKFDPPQRKPLTEEMEARCPYAKANPTLRGAFFDGWLNSERAHGIKE